MNPLSRRSLFGVAVAAPAAIVGVVAASAPVKAVESLRIEIDATEIRELVRAMENATRQSERRIG